MTPEMEKVLMEAVVVLLRHNTDELAECQPVRFDNMAYEHVLSHGWKLAEQIEKNLSLVAVKPENCAGHSYRSMGYEGEWVCVFCGYMYCGLPPLNIHRGC